PGARPVNSAPAPERDRWSSSPPLILPAPGEKPPSAGIAGYVPAPQRPRQNLDRVPGPVGKTHRHDQRPPRSQGFRLGETHTRLSKKDHKLPRRASALRPGLGSKLGKALLATHRQLP